MYFSEIINTVLYRKIVYYTYTYNTMNNFLKIIYIIEFMFNISLIRIQLFLLDIYFDVFNITF